MYEQFFFRKIKNISYLQKNRMLQTYEIKSYNTSGKTLKISLYGLNNCLKWYQLKTLFKYYFIITFNFLIEKNGVTVFDGVFTIQ